MKDEQPGFDTSVRENDNIRRHIQNSLNVTFSNLGVLRDHLTCLCLGDMLVVIQDEIGFKINRFCNEHQCGTEIGKDGFKKYVYLKSEVPLSIRISLPYYSFDILFHSFFFLIRPGSKPIFMLLTLRPKDKHGTMYVPYQ